MNRFSAQLTLLVIFTFLIAGCSDAAPTTQEINQAPEFSNHARSSGTQLWGYYTVNLDTESRTASVKILRTVNYSVNVNTFLNAKPALLGIVFNDLNTGPGYVDVDLDVSITHPIPNQDKFTGYDVRGVLIGDGGKSMQSDQSLKYAATGDQMLLNADGYTRWFNVPEFGSQGLFGYTPGLYGTKLLEGTATLNGYKYFSDGLGPSADAWEYVTSTGNRQFSSGETNTRNYMIRFPVPSPGVQFDYAVLADWSGTLPENHPSYAHESPVATTTVENKLWYSLTAGEGGGDLSFDLSLLGMDDSIPSTIIVESTVLNSPYVFTQEDMIPTEVGVSWVTWHVEISQTNVQSAAGNEMFITAVYNEFDYTNPFGVPNDSTGHLSTYFRIPLKVKPGYPASNIPPDVLDGVSGKSLFSPSVAENYTVDATDWEADPLTYAWTIVKLPDMSSVYSGPGDGAGVLHINWGALGAVHGNQYLISCQVSDPTNPAVPAIPLKVDCMGGQYTPIWLYDGLVNDGGMESYVYGLGIDSWAYCPASHSWDENECTPYFSDTYSFAISPVIDFPDSGTFTKIHIEIWHWGSMQEDGACYGSPGLVEDNGDGTFTWTANWNSEDLVYIDGFNFNDNFVESYADWSGTFGTQSTPVRSHFDCSAYAGKNAAIGFQFEEYGIGNPENLSGWNIRKIWVYVE